MKAAFDHLVHFLHRSPAEGSALLAQAGFHPSPGGRHTAWGTWNSLSYFGLSYIECLAVENDEVAGKCDNPLIRQLVEEKPAGEGFGQIAIRTTQILEWSKRLTHAGLEVTGPIPGSRQREDGTTVRWQMLFARDPESGMLPPFFIQWEQSDEERFQELSKRGMIRNHPNGSARLGSVAYAVRDLERAVGTWSCWLGWEAGQRMYDAQLEAHCRTFPMPGGNVTLCEPSGAGPTQQMLDKRGERPFCVRVEGDCERGQHVLFGGIYITEPLDR